MLLLCVLAAACVPRPKQAYTVDQIPQIGSLEEIMRVQAQTMDPLFARREKPSFTPAELQALAEGGRRIQASSATVRERFAAGRKASFAAYAGTLNTQAGELLAAAEAKDAARTRAALGAMRETCRGCHRENR